MVVFTVDEIIEKLRGYVRVDDISEVPLNTHIRYFVKNPDGDLGLGTTNVDSQAQVNPARGDQSFRLGGFLVDKQNPNKYIILTNGKNSWTVQVNTATFFKKMNREEEIDFINRQYQKILNEKYHQ